MSRPGISPALIHPTLCVVFQNLPGACGGLVLLCERLSVDRPRSGPVSPLGSADTYLSPTAIVPDSTIQRTMERDSCPHRRRGSQVAGPLPHRGAFSSLHLSVFA